MGGCLFAIPPPPEVEGPLAVLSPLGIEPEEPPGEFAGEDRTAAAFCCPKLSPPVTSRHAKLLEHPHACVAFSDVATWGSPSSVDTDTDVPSTSDELTMFDESVEDEFDFDDDFPVHGGADRSVELIPTQEDRLVEQKLDAWLLDNDEPCEADAEEDIPVPRRRKRNRKRRWYHNMLNTNPWIYDVVASIQVPEHDPHAQQVDKDVMQNIIKDEGKTIVPPAKVKASVGPELERWKLAAEAELKTNFENTHAFHPSTPDDIARHGRPLPMLCVWSKQESADYAKCRACVCGNFAEVDPTQQSWTAQAEPSSLLASLKIGCVKGWTVSKHDVKGAFLNAKLPEGRLVVVQPPQIWISPSRYFVDFGKGSLWTARVPSSVVS